MRLTAAGIKATSDPGYYPDGEGLYLQVSASGTKSWILRFMFNKRAREMGLGILADHTLASAREQAQTYRQMLRKGIDPIEHRRTEREQLLITTAQRRTFAECAVEYHRLHAHGWKNAKHAGQWINTLTTYAYPRFGKKDVSDVTKGDIVAVLEPIWFSKPETASRLRQRVKAVLDFAAAKDYRHAHDPHIWDQVRESLPKTKDIKKVKHFAACPYTTVHQALASIRNSNAGDTVKRAFEFIILTAARSGEARGAAWSEIDFEGKRWTIPAERMKAAKEHQVPLSPRVMEILESQRGNGSNLIFPSPKDKPYSDMTFTMALRRLGHEFTVHGFRSTFRDWAGETTAFPREVIEHALAHQLKDKTEAAYSRSTLFEKRRLLMDTWAAYCATPTAKAEQI